MYKYKLLPDEIILGPALSLVLVSLSYLSVCCITVSDNEDADEQILIDAVWCSG